jgi:hypothetical protein
MAHFALIDDGSIVREVIVISNAIAAAATSRHRSRSARHSLPARTPTA